MDNIAASQHASERIVSILLHAHLPYGLRVDLETSLEQAWLCEAVTGCYLPLLGVIQRLAPRQHAPWLTLSLSPTLLELWTHPEFPTRYRKHLKQGLGIIEHEMRNAQHPLERRLLAQKIKTQWDEAAKHFDSIDGNLAQAFSEAARRGSIEIITTAATHAFLPGHQTNRAYRQFQIENGLETFTRHTGIKPQGFWLPECGYFPGLEADLAEHGIKYFALEEVGLTAASPPASILQPLACPNGLLALGRNAALSQKVWNARSGYPGNHNYREFHQDGIHDVDNTTCGNFALPDGGRLPFGLKYWRVTGSPNKDWYEPEIAAQQVEADAKHFVHALSKSEKGLAFLPFDAELFGHWWHEGPLWLEKVLHAADQLPDTSVQSAGSVCGACTNPPKGRPASSTWGRKSDYSFWINHETDWIYPLLRHASDVFKTLVQEHESAADSLTRHAICQAARELLLAGASDWPFMIRAGATTDYAMQRLRDHIGRFHFLQQSLQMDSLAPGDLQLLETLNPAFKQVSLRAYETGP